MPEVTLTQASGIVQKDRSTVFQWVQDELLPARRVGLRRDIRIDLSELEKFAKQYGYDYDAALAAQYGK